MMSEPSPAENPLLRQQFPIPFDKVRAEHVEPAIGELLANMRQRVERLSETPERTYESIFAVLDRLTDPLDYAMQVVGHLEAVATYPELRAAYNAVQGPVSAFYTSIPLNADLWRAVKETNERADRDALSPVQLRYLDKTVRGFRRAGADLDPEGKAKLEALDVELTEVTTKFSENVLDSTNAFELLITDEAKLAGLPESARAAAKASAESKKKDGWRFTLQAPSLIAAMTYLEDRSIRRELWQASDSRGTKDPFDNRQLVATILRLRREKAQLLGFDDFADLVLEERMAHDGARAQRFLEDLQAKSQPFFARENESLGNLGQQLGYQTLEPWDVAYLAEKQRLALYEFDEEELRPYFQLDQVVRGMFEIFGRILSIKVIPESGVSGWDPEVKYYRIEDAATATFLGGFYADWFPRENKRGGAWMDAFITGNPLAGEPHLGLICGNLTPPVGETPSLITHREVETIFHEFGHLLHHTLSLVPVRSLSGTNVPWDFVELPSQIMENWCMEREAIDLFARHYKTGEGIPDELFQKMKRARNFRSANAQMRQLSFGLVDLKLHREYDPVRDGDVMEYARKVLAPFAAARLPDDYGMIASFSHLFSGPVGYGAGYYSYKWAEVLDADAFTRFRQEGIFNTKTGADYRHSILERGNSDDPAELYRKFMGRDPDSNALLEREGLVGAA
jgi:oligopeptidase A